MHLDIRIFGTSIFTLHIERDDTFNVGRCLDEMDDRDLFDDCCTEVTEPEDG